MKKERLRLEADPRSSVWLVAYAALALLVFANIWADPRSRWIGTPKDPKLFLWYLSYLPHALSHGLSPFVSTAINWPAGTNLLWNSSVVVPALVLSPITALLGPVVAYNLMVTSAVALSAWVAALAARIFVAGRWTPFLVGLFYGFSPAIMAQALGHPHVLIAVFPPLALILANEILVRQRWRAAVIGAITGLAAALQLLTGEEMLVLTAVIALIGVALLAAIYPHQVRGRFGYAARATLVAAAAFLVLSAYPLWVQFFGPQRILGQLQPADRYVTDLLSFVVPNQNLVQNSFTRTILDRFTGNYAEDNAYLGIPLLVLFVTGVVFTWRRPALRWLSLLTLVMAVLSLGPHLHINGWISPVPLPWILVGGLPLFRNIVPARFMLPAIFGVAVVVAVLLSELGAQGRWQRGAGWVGLGAALVLIAPQIPPVSTASAAPAFFTTKKDLARIPQNSVALLTPYADSNSADAMYWQALAHFRFQMPEADAFSAGPFLGPSPTYLGAVLDHLDQGIVPDSSAGGRARALRDLARWQVQTIIVGPSQGHDATVAYLTSLLGSPPTAVDGVDVWWRCCPNSAGP